MLNCCYIHNFAVPGRPLQTRLHSVDVGHGAQVFFQYEVVGVQATGTVVQESETVVQSSDELESVIKIEPFV
jgi:hypothetical protein